jgi:PAS domain S-box-containing protein
VSKSAADFDAGQRLLLERIAHGAPLEGLLRELVRLVEQQASPMACSVLLVDGEQGTVHPIAAPSLPVAYTQALEGEKIGPEAGSCGTAAFLKQRVIVADIATHPFWRDYKELALRHGLRACWSTPILTADRTVLGTFAMYYNEPREPTSIEMAWVDAATHVATIAILRDRSEHALRSSEQRYRKLAHELDERVKELTLVHNVARLLQDHREIDQSLIEEIALLVPPAFLLPGQCEARMRYGELEAATPGFWRTEHRVTETFETGGQRGVLEAGYPSAAFAGGEPIFLVEERQLMRSVADMLSSSFGRNHAVRALRASEERLRAVVEHTPNVAIQGYDAQGRVLFANQASLAMFGWRLETAIGKTLDQLDFSEHDTARFTQSLAQVAATGQPIGPMELSFRRADGRSGVLLSTVFRIPLGERGSCVVCTDVDLTDFKNAQEAARSAEDARRMLEQRLIEAERLKGLGTLAGGIAHDFNNILTAVRGHTDLALLQARDNPVAHRSLEEVRSACLRANKLVRQILTFGQQQAPKREAVSLRAMVDEALGLIGSTLPAAIELRTQLAPGACSIWADATQVHQVLMNVAVNAISAMSERAGVIDVVLEHIEVSETPRHLDLASGRYERLRIQDQGEGMSPETLARAFDPFFTTKPAGTGTGLGLSVVHGIMKSHEGAVAIDSEVGRGTTFDLYFPAANHAPARDPAAVKAGEGHGEHVLYVDDDEALVVLTLRLLRRLGYRATGLTDPLEALAMLRRDPRSVDVVISDVNMPLLTGPELIREIKQLQPSMPTALVSGFVPGGSTAGAPSDDISLKPQTLEQLAELLRRVLPASAERSIDTN